MKTSWFLATIFAAGACATALAAPLYTNFVVAADATTFKPAQPLHKGDRLLVQSPSLLGYEVLLLVRCLDGCAQTEIVRAWNGRSSGHSGPDLYERVTIQQDGDYYFAPNEIPVTLPDANFRGCLRSLPLHKLCSDAHAVRITESNADASWFRVRLSSGNWIWVRATLVAPKR
jgi:hypothetical protein